MKSNTIKKISMAIAIASTLFVLSCKKDDDASIKIDAKKLETYMSKYEIEAFNEINEARRDPPAYARKYIKPLLDDPKFDHTKAVPGKNAYEYAVQTAYDELMQLKPRPEFTADPGLVMAMRTHLSSPYRLDAHSSSKGGDLNNSASIAKLYSYKGDPNFPKTPEEYAEKTGDLAANYDYARWKAGIGGIGGNGEAIENGIRTDCKGLNAGRTFALEWIIDNANEAVGTNWHWGHRDLVMSRGNPLKVENPDAPTKAGFAMGNTSAEYAKLKGIKRDAGLVPAGKNYQTEPELLKDLNWRPKEVTWKVPSKMDVVCPIPAGS